MSQEEQRPSEARESNESLILDKTSNDVNEKKPNSPPASVDAFLSEHQLYIERSFPKGRGLYASKPIKAGTSLISEQPFVYALSNNVCHKCWQEPDSLGLGQKSALPTASPETSKQLLRCSNCKFAFYCSKKCQTEDWFCHKIRCKSIKQLAPNTPSLTIICLGELYLKLLILQNKNELATNHNVHDCNIAFNSSNHEELLQHSLIPELKNHLKCGARASSSSLPDAQNVPDACSDEKKQCDGDAVDPSDPYGDCIESDFDSFSDEDPVDAMDPTEPDPVVSKVSNVSDPSQTLASAVNAAEKQSGSNAVAEKKRHIPVVRFDLSKEEINTILCIIGYINALIENYNKIGATLKRRYDKQNELQQKKACVGDVGDPQFEEIACLSVGNVAELNDLKNEIYEIWNKFVINAISVSNFEFKPIGIGLFPIIGASVNHSCSPNAIAIFDSERRECNIRAVCDIGAKEEICINYIDITQPRFQRKSELMKSYKFDCNCAFCNESDGNEIDMNGLFTRNVIDRLMSNFLCLKCVRKWIDSKGAAVGRAQNESGLLLKQKLWVLDEFDADNYICSNKRCGSKYDKKFLKSKFDCVKAIFENCSQRIQKYPKHLWFEMEAKGNFKRLTAEIALILEDLNKALLMINHYVSDIYWLKLEMFKLKERIEIEYLSDYVAGLNTNLKILNAYLVILPNYSPFLGMQYAVCAKLLHYNNDLQCQSMMLEPSTTQANESVKQRYKMLYESCQRACKYFKQALSILVVSHGPGSEMVNGLSKDEMTAKMLLAMLEKQM